MSWGRSPRFKGDQLLDVLVAGFALKVSFSEETYEVRPEERRRDLISAGLATIYALFMLFAGGFKYASFPAIFLAPGTVLTENFAPCAQREKSLR